MKLGTPFYILLTVVFVLTSVSIIINEFNVNYPEAGVNESTLDSRYSFTTDINNSFSDISRAAEKVGESEGWWDKLVGGTWVIWLALVTMITALISSIPLFGTLLADMGSTIGVPAPLIAIAFISVTGAVIVMLIKFQHRGS